MFHMLNRKENSTILQILPKIPTFERCLYFLKALWMVIAANTTSAHFLFGAFWIFYFQRKRTCTYFFAVKKILWTMKQFTYFWALIVFSKSSLNGERSRNQIRKFPFWFFLDNLYCKEKEYVHNSLSRIIKILELFYTIFDRVHYQALKYTALTD